MIYSLYQIMPIEKSGCGDKMTPKWLIIPLPAFFFFFFAILDPWGDFLTTIFGVGGWGVHNPF